MKIYVVIGLWYGTLEYSKATKDKRNLVRFRREAKELECDPIFTLLFIG